MSKWVEIGASDEFPSGTKKCKTAGTMPVVICNVEGEMHAFQNVCPHAGLPLGDGPLHGKVITCPFHGFAYNVQTGKNVDFDGDIPLKTYPVRVEDGKIEVNIG